MKKLISRILISVGIIIIGIAVFIEASTIYNQKKLIDEYSKYNETLKNMEISELTAEAAVSQESDINIEVDDSELQIREQPGQEETEVPEEAPKNTAPDLTEIFKNKQISGLIEIPKIKVNAAILEGTDDSALQYAVGHYPGLGEIGQPGNYVLLGHRNYVYGHFFRNIDKLEVDDQIILTKGTDIYTYSVTESFVVKPEEVWVLEQTEEATITLITCTPVGTYTDRLIVKGVLLDND